MQVVKTIEILTKSGSLLTVDLSDVLLERIKAAFNLNDLEQVESRHIEAYLIASMRNALKAEDASTN